MPDEIDRIGARLRELADGGQVFAIFTTGGTGVARRDVTPEATRAAIDREIPGLAELMRARGLEKTPRAVLSRAVAGTRGNVLIVNLPGSPRGAVESLDAIVELVPHVLDLLQGHTEHGSEGYGYMRRVLILISISTIILWVGAVLVAQQQPVVTQLPNEPAPQQNDNQKPEKKQKKKKEKEKNKEEDTSKPSQASRTRSRTAEAQTEGRHEARRTRRRHADQPV